MSPSNSIPASPAVYTPGYRKTKILMILYGVLLLSLGVSQLWTPLRLLAIGKRAKAEAVAVVKTKEGLPDLVLTNDLAVRSQLEAHDRSYIFWNHCRFHTPEGQIVNLRAPVGSQLKPLFPLTDADGLPTEMLIYYDPAAPEQAVFPLLISVWFAPGVLFIAGLGCIIIASTLLYWANKPIELPHIQPVACPSPE